MAVSPIAAPASGPAPVLPPARWLSWLVRRLGNRKWDLVLRGAGVAAAIGIPVTLFLPQHVALVWFALLAVPANGPWSPVVPVAFEPLILEVAKYEAVGWVTLVGVTVHTYMEHVNWQLYSWALGRNRLEPFRESRAVTAGVRMFAMSPFWAVVVFAFTPLPFWVVRILAIVRGYSVRRFLVAHVIGRVPRTALLAWVGAALQLSTWLLLSVLVITTLVSLVWVRRPRPEAAP